MKQEKEWILSLKILPLLNIPLGRIIVLSPHPDDETLGAGGLIHDFIKNKIEVEIIALTDGENAYNDVDNLREIRIKEQEKALVNLGLSSNKITRLSLGDGSLDSIEEKLLELIIPLIKPGDILFAPWYGDYHSDHEATGRVAIKIYEALNVSLFFYFIWTWQQKTFDEIKHLPLCIHPLSAQAMQQKCRAIDCYSSQITHPHGKAILPPNILLSAQRAFETYSPYNLERIK